MLLGAVVWAATQIAESSNKENNGAFNFMAVSPLRIMFFITHCRRGAGALESGGISRFLKAFPYGGFGVRMEKLQVRAGEEHSISYAPSRTAKTTSVV